MHYEWKVHLIGDNISDKGFSVFEIDESKIIGNNDLIYWMFGIIDRISKEERIFCVLNNRTGCNLMKIIKNNIATTNNININLEDDNNEIPRIYFDSFTPYQPNNFRQNGYILKRVNHSIWFRYGNFHTNNIEGVWSQIKRLSSNFSGISINSLQESCNTDEEKREILDSWICYALFFREIERLKLIRKGKIKLLIKDIRI